MGEAKKLLKYYSSRTLFYLSQSFTIIQNTGANKYVLKVKNGNTRKKWVICSKLTINTPK